MANDTTVDGTPASMEGQTIGVVNDTASAQVLKNVLPGATLKNFTTPKETLDAFYTGDVFILGVRRRTAGRRLPRCTSHRLGNS
ncbi:hypothetical protein [Synechococcus sp. WH 8109]|uniref:hypothetical protein n=1 Tax=Synechococcus sp. WH 8109 TaxID=166314 RepID=UPI0002FEA90C|nr:hypothetical protein [Synechococcus sp. WH 8109]